jgi:hypothetical protein
LAPIADAQQGFYISHWGFGIATGDGTWITAESAAVDAAAAINGAFNFDYTSGTCQGPTYPTSAGQTKFCFVNASGQLPGDLPLEAVGGNCHLLGQYEYAISVPNGL